MSPKPSFDSLPLRKDGPNGNAWGLFGDDDQCGMVNLLTPENTAAAAKEVVEGVRISTDWPLGAMTKPCFGRQPFKQQIHHKAPRTVNDDILTLNTQSSSQWDGLRHFGWQKEKVYFNGIEQDAIMNSDVNGIHVWAEKGGIVGRGVLLDYAAWAEAKGIKVNLFETTPIKVDTLKEVAASQGTTFRDGDILFIRTGWTQEYEKLQTDQRLALAEVNPPPAIGLESSEDTLRWLWENNFAAVAGDHPAMEAFPIQNMEFCLHEWLLAGWGMPIGELFDLRKLGEECGKRKRYTFFFSSVPLKVMGGVASPPNGVAIF
ncbi:hypothetical protein K4F52_001987 [Lecanicillium sp. MT-2017a]|nr:hypothetical protein K4F52_001987 [Lecanicillium sp. MT-2017a]